MLQAVHGWLPTHERLVKSQKFFSSYLTQEDLSRLGRNSAMTGLYTNITFPKYGVRYIAINDNFDTSDQNGMGIDMAGIKNWINEFYARDTLSLIHILLLSGWQDRCEDQLHEHSHHD